MRSFLLTTFMGFLFFQLVAQDFPAFAERQLVVKFKDEIEVIRFESDVQLSYGQDILDDLKLRYPIKKIKSVTPKNVLKAFVIHFEKDENILQLEHTFFDSGIFEYCEANYTGHAAGRAVMVETIPSDDFFNRQYGLYNDGSFTLDDAIADADIDMELAWDIEQGDESIVVAILDSGVNHTHPEFEGRIFKNVEEMNNGEDTDNNGYIDDVNGWDFAYEDNLPDDAHGHGTNVAGIAVATGDNDLGYAGVDWNCKMMPLKILNDNDFGLYTWWAEAMVYAVDNGAHVLNMSVGGSSSSNILQTAAEYVISKGSICVASMMNWDNDTKGYPAAIEQVIAVGSTDADDTRSSPFFWDAFSGSNFGDHIDVVAPGNFIYGLHNINNNNYNSYWGGTSQATPLVTGLCALMLAQDPMKSPEEIRSIVQQTAEDQVGDPAEDTPGFDIYYGHGRINAFNALSYTPLSTTDSNFSTNEYSIYPNPASDEISLEFNDHTRYLEIYNSLGQLIYSKPVLTGHKNDHVDLNTISKGHYTVYFLNENKELLASEKFILR